MINTIFLYTHIHCFQHFYDLFGLIGSIICIHFSEIILMTIRFLLDH